MVQMPVQFIDHEAAAGVIRCMLMLAGFRQAEAAEEAETLLC